MSSGSGCTSWSRRWTRFVRVSNSEIVNLDRVTALDLTLAGTIKMTLEGGTVCWVSRRYVRKIRQALEA